MPNKHKNVVLDRKANRLLLNPPKKQTSNWGLGFMCSIPATDMDILENDRRAICQDINAGNGRARTVRK